VELACALEDRYQVTINDVDFAKVNTVAELEKMVAGPITAGASPFQYPQWAQSPAMQALRILVYYLVTYPATYLLSWPRISGRGHLAGLREPVLVISNHVAYVDIGFVLAALPFRLRNRLAVAMEGERVRSLRHPVGVRWFEGFIYRAAYWLMTALFNVFPLPKASGFRESFAYAGSSIDRGYSVLVFPEGLRTQNGQMAPFRRGIGILTSGLRVPVVPMRIEGLWETKRAGWRGFAPWGRIKVRVGAPLRFAESDSPEAITAKLEETVRGLSQG
jgi:long-chain acyl-CoA synthetase